MRFMVKQVPRGARVASARLNAMPLVKAGPGSAVRLSFFLEDSIDRKEISQARPIVADHLFGAAGFSDIAVSEQWQLGKSYNLIDLAPLLQQLVNRADWNPDGSVVTVVIQGTADQAFMQQNGYSPGPFVNPVRYTTTLTLELAVLPASFAASVAGGLFAPELRPLLLAGLRALADQPMLFVEASAPFWLREEPAGEPALTALQFLPTGVQLAELSNPQDYAPSNPSGDPAWQLLVMPFLGRLQNADRDVDATSPLQLDPVLLLRGRASQPGPLPRLALVLANRGDAEPLTFDVSPFETLASRTLARLDRTALQENWLRLQRLVPEPTPASLPGIMASLPNSPARLSRDVALRRLLDALRRDYPPRLPDPYELPPQVDDTQLIWRQASLLLLEGLVRPHEEAGKLYAWRLAALPLMQLAGRAGGRSQRYPAVTILPAWPAPYDTLPVGFAVSPYLGLAFQPRSDGDVVPALRVVEMLAFDPARTTSPDEARSALRPVASLTRDEEAAPVGAEEPDPVVTWAVETARRLAPESPLIVLRTRSVNRDAVGRAVTDYAYDIHGMSRTGHALARRTVRLRTGADTLRFRQGQFCPFAMPRGLQPFEVAAPQTIGLQPVYLTSAPGRVRDSGDPVAVDWPWGLSVLRAAIQYTANQEGVAAAPLGPSSNGSAAVLWWQSVQVGVQYREASGGPRPAASLPRLFRSRAIAALLPVNPNPPLPLLTPQDVGGPAAADPQAPALSQWQPVLPGRLRYLLTGSRPGVPLAFRHLLLRQSLDSAQPLVVSGSVPVQHRSPRPVALPQNRAAGQTFALQTWASHFEPGTTAAFSYSPFDETFSAACEGVEAHGLRVSLNSPRHGLLTAGWQGDVTFSLAGHPEGAKWELVCALVGNGVSLALQADPADGIYSAPGTYTLLPQDPAKVQEALASIRSLAVQVRPARGAPPVAAGVYQSVSLPLAYAATDLRLPLVPVFVHFEDPEYNRRLGSVAAFSLALFMVQEKAVGGAGPLEPVAHQLRLSLDRKAYNPTSEIAFRYDWDNPTVIPNPDATSIVLSLTRGDGTRSILFEWKAGGASPCANAAICLTSLSKLAASAKLEVHSGDRLELKARFPDESGGAREIALEVEVVEEPVIPAPEAAYALLRWSRAVEAARFAWNPEASRIELVCPEDLRNGFVRRRAVFHWQDTVRAGQAVEYALQKITEGGSTHWPSFALAGRPALSRR